MLILIGMQMVHPTYLMCFTMLRDLAALDYSIHTRVVS